MGKEYRIESLQLSDNQDFGVGTVGDASGGTFMPRYVSRAQLSIALDAPADITDLLRRMAEVGIRLSGRTDGSCG